MWLSEKSGEEGGGEKWRHLPLLLCRGVEKGKITWPSDGLRSAKIRTRVGPRLALVIRKALKDNGMKEGDGHSPSPPKSAGLFTSFLTRPFSETISA